MGIKLMQPPRLGDEAGKRFSWTVGGAPIDPRNDLARDHRVHLISCLKRWG